MTYRMLLAAGTATLIALPAHATDWAPREFNPHPDPGDYVLPMPCGAVMVFRPVEVISGDKPLDDMAVQLGDPDPAAGAREYIREGHVAGPFKGPDGKPRYYIGKYDVTVDQYATLRGTGCSAPAPPGRVPQTGITHLEALSFAQDWTVWLRRNAAAALPRHGKDLAFVRLPTEDEWEFAARGGTHVTLEEFHQRTWPMPEGVERYVAVGDEATGGRPQPVGRFLPNPLGLYDMLGNVAQFALEPFRLNRVGRFAGQPGGIVLRGGSYLMSPGEPHTSWRVELPPFAADTGAATRSDTVGFRVVLAANDAPTLADADRAQQQFRDETETHPADKPAREQLQQLREEITTQAQKEALDRVRAMLAAADQERLDAARLALRAQVEATTGAAYLVWTRERLIQFVQLKGQLFGQMGFQPPPDEAAKDAAIIDYYRKEQRWTVDAYLSSVRAILASPVGDELEQQASLATQALMDQCRLQQAAFVPVLLSHAAVLGAHRALANEKVAREIGSVPKPARRPERC
jgi:formylglycine-generating enzyme required for sulfatase activity